MSFTLISSLPVFANSDHSAGSANPAADPGARERRQAATSQFARAEEQRAALSGKPSEKRTLNDYKQVVGSYRRVYLITPHAAEVPDSLVAIAELYAEMGDRFGRPYYQSAVDSYQFLLREYPTSRFVPEAYLRSGRLQKDQLGDLAGATKTYDTFLKKFPHAKQRREAQEARAELALLQRATSPAMPDTAKSAVARSAGAEETRESRPPVVSRDVPARGTRQADTGKATAEAADSDDDDGTEPVAVSGRIPQVQKISARAAADSTRVTIDLEGSVQYVSGRVANPDRIYFDLHAARLAQPLLHRKIEAE
ncbi:MAG TPA: AMIN domain-containing protein, partial [Candidatus Acidoferrum sp.]|nr:AMIN domain-containing protein [Candidatus Acidoferrum sp.]